jgi:hypothetical protein
MTRSKGENRRIKAMGEIMKHFGKAVGGKRVDQILKGRGPSS